MSCCDLRQYCSYSCVSYITAVSFALITLAIGVIGLCGLFKYGDPCFYGALITLVCGLFVRLPDLKKSKDIESH